LHRRRLLRTTEESPNLADRGAAGCIEVAVA
jgi:hypothetical protein